jgi:hypothetical protein
MSTLQWPNALRSAGFSSDRKHILAACNDEVIVWSADLGNLPTVLRGNNAWVNTAVFSSGGRRILTASNDNAARLWDTASGELVATLRWSENHVTSAALSPDGSHIVTTSEEKVSRIWTSLSPDAGPPPEWFASLLRVRAQHRLNSKGDLVEIGTDEWIEMRTKLREVLASAGREKTGYLGILRDYLD